MKGLSQCLSTPRSPSAQRRPISPNYEVAFGYLPSLVRQWCPDGKRCGREYVALNPTRPDRHPGSFSVNLVSGAWADFSTGDRGGDPRHCAYVFGTNQVEAARTLAAALGVEVPVMRPFKYHNRNFSPNASRPDKDLKLRDARQLDLFEYIPRRQEAGGLCRPR